MTLDARIARLEALVSGHQVTIERLQETIGQQQATNRAAPSLLAAAP